MNLEFYSNSLSRTWTSYSPPVTSKHDFLNSEMHCLEGVDSSSEVDDCCWPSLKKLIRSIVGDSKWGKLKVYKSKICKDFLFSKRQTSKIDTGSGNANENVTYYCAHLLLLPFYRIFKNVNDPAMFHKLIA